VSRLRDEFFRILARGPRVYFAPVLGAIRGIRDEYRMIDEEDAAWEKQHREKWDRIEREEEERAQADASRKKA